MYVLFEYHSTKKYIDFLYCDNINNHTHIDIFEFIDNGNLKFITRQVLHFLFFRRIKCRIHIPKTCLTAPMTTRAAAN